MGNQLRTILHRVANALPNIRSAKESDEPSPPIEAEAPEMEEELREIGKAEELSKKRCRRVYAEFGTDADLVLIAVNNKFTAMSAWCSHMGGPLHGGDVMEYKSKMCIQCPWHGYMFDIEDGVHPDIGLRQEVFETLEKDGKVFIRYPKCKLSLEPFEHEDV